MTTNIPLLEPADATQNAEFTELAKQGTALQWMFRIAQNRLKKYPNDPNLKPLLVSIAISEDLWCRTTDSDALISQAKVALSKLASK